MAEIDADTQVEKLKEQVERLKAVLREREEATRYEVEIFVVGQWSPVWRGNSRKQAKAEAERVSADRLPGPEPGYVRARGFEEVWDNAQLVSDTMEARRNANYGTPPGMEAQPMAIDDPRINRF